MYDYVIRGGTIVDGTGQPSFTGDIAVADGRIVEVGGRVDGSAREEFDADGAVVSPGWVDIHTHYDGQVAWDDQLEPSAANGVTTVVMGNCGVGFAPVPAGGVQTLIELMEGVEDIPGTALYEGIPWGAWETFPEYLDFLATRSYAIDIGAQLAHGALRYYAMGDRGVANEDATAADLAEMGRIVEEAMRAGALGFSTSRTIGHRSVTGVPVPGTFAAETELQAIAAAMGRADRGVFEAIASGTVGSLSALGGEHQTTDDEVRLFGRLSAASGRPLTFTTVQIFEDPTGWRRMLDIAAEANAEGAQLHPQVACRPVGFITSLSAYHMFMRRPSYRAIEHLPLPDRVAAMRNPEVKSAILGESDVRLEQQGSMAGLSALFGRAMSSMYPLRDPVNYEPRLDESIVAVAKAQGREAADVMYDFLLEDGGRSFASILGSNFFGGSIDVCREMLLAPHSVSGLSDAGAHVNFICDVSMPTFLLTHWVRDRDLSRGPRLPIEHVVAKQTGGNAALYGLADRGTITPGKRADINVIDLEHLQIHVPEARQDLPAGGTRVVQLATGYLATMVAGAVTRRNDTDTGARPGRLVRSGS